ncbi:LOW QUALITY PROTEIN: WD repeat-containing protein 74 [Strigops habroptila]|uniref:LOW QUALITY PROTEIN: WD repeat-containing protein 74 n=1 Tax=Strigops habroptila TaxID=2489341 RepID=UPI0011CF2BFA|nr:LOW QUALITY PROTEIN: WD repeat-containing protein 74 [Strigops habroptila]
MAAPTHWSHVWVGAETGALKGVNLRHQRATNYTSGSALRRGEAARALCWGDPRETELLVGGLDRCVRLFSTEKGQFTGSRLCAGGEGPFCGLATLGSSIVTCVESGLIKVWREDGTEHLSLEVGEGLCRMRQDPARPQRVGTGGRENGLKVWDLQRPEQPLFRAKNVRNDWLDLRVPIWDRDLQFLPGSGRIVTCTAHRQVRLYDPGSPQRRPVLEATFGEGPLTALAVVPGETSVVVGSARGDMAVIDLRKGRVLRSLRGGAGGVRGLQCHPRGPLVASCGLDRFLRLHHVGEGRLCHKVYLKSQLSCLLLSTQHDWESEEELPPPAEVKEEEEEDALWDSMETVPTPQKRGKKRKI